MRMLGEGKNYFEISHYLKITQENLHSTIYQMRKKGMVVERRATKFSITPTQREIMYFYMENVPVPEIAKRMRITCQTVLNHASQAFKRLDLTTPGIDRIVALRKMLQPKPITMDDPFFN